nr:ancylostoma secreted protein 2 [Haemonchus contortus]
MTNWWGQLARNGVDEPNMKLTPRLRYRLNSIIDFSKVYDCAVEASAIRHAQTCDGELSSEGSRPGLKENIQKINDLSLDYSAAAEQAMTIWWSELARSGIRSDMLFDYPTRHRTINIVTHWSKV